ncbi:MAG: hypothetical protein KatS3mg002_0497 [Candidatus Woesearchaeota archaeon]|nr:MAG: hypothetical protein KatS3mg002_0497 [Candidatus Woesearchaeota archaeon]
MLLFICLLLCSFSVYAVSIKNLHIEDFLNTDLSMREEIFLSIKNNTNNEFRLTLPDDAFDISINNISLAENSSAYDALYCMDCDVIISYSFSDIVFNSSYFYQFYRRIDFPINVDFFSYSIIIPEGHDLLNIKGSIFPDDFIVDFYKNSSRKGFYWKYDNITFPRDFGIRYQLSVSGNYTQDTLQDATLQDNHTFQNNFRKNESEGLWSGIKKIDYLSISIVAVITFLLLVFIFIFVIVSTRTK